MTPPIRYSIAPLSPESHLFEVGCTVTDPDPAGQRFALPAWNPGSYLVRDFARHVVAIRAASGGLELPLEKLDKHTWRAGPTERPVTVVCEIYAWDLSVRGAHLDASHGFFNGACVFLRALGREDRRCELNILAPRGSRYRNWRVATSMPRLRGAVRAPERARARGYGWHAATEYEELIDHPVEMGEFTIAAFRAGGVPHHVAISGRHRVDTGRLCRDLKRLCEQHIGLFGRSAAGRARPPFDRYLFLVTAAGEGYGGLEHRASTALLCSRDDLPQPGMKDGTENYRRFLGLASHEYFHAWNVKRIRPAAFFPYDLDRENYTALLWAFEGLTSYYDDLALVRSGLITRGQYLEILGRSITAYLRAPGRERQTLAESSFDAWTKYYRQDENSPNAIVSYYVKGSLVGLCLDLLIRSRTRGRKSLDDVMRALWQRHGMTGIGVEEDGVERAAQEATGLNLARFFDHALRSTRELPLARLLRAHGIRMALRPAESLADKGGKAASKERPELALRPSLGIRARTEGKEVLLTHVLEGGAAQDAGLAGGDVLVAADGLRIGARGLDTLLDRRRAGETVRVHAFRGDELRVFDVRLGKPARDTCVLEEQGSAALRTRWLGDTPAGPQHRGSGSTRQGAGQ